MSKLYTGIGSRKTPEIICKEMTHIASELAKKGYALRSGGADGADTAFEEGALRWAKLWLGGNGTEIYLPCSGWNRKGRNDALCYTKVQDDAKKIAAELHPNWNACSDFAKKLLGRNVYQILGYYLDRPSSFVVCWTKNGEAVGGTAIGIRLAKKHGIPVYNLALAEDKKEFYTKELGIRDVFRYLSDLGLENSGLSEQG